MYTVSPAQIRAARAFLGLSQEDLAKKASVSLSAIARIEQEKGDPRLGTLEKIARALEKLGMEFLPPSDGKGEGLRVSKDRRR